MKYYKLISVKHDYQTLVKVLNCYKGIYFSILCCFVVLFFCLSLQLNFPQARHNLLFFPSLLSFCFVFEEFLISAAALGQVFIFVTEKVKKILYFFQRIDIL